MTVTMQLRQRRPEQGVPVGGRIVGQGGAVRDTLQEVGSRPAQLALRERAQSDSPHPSGQRLGHARQRRQPGGTGEQEPSRTRVVVDDALLDMSTSIVSKCIACLSQGAC